MSTNLPEKSEIKKAVNNYCKEKGISKACLSVQCGVSDATLSALEKEKWGSISNGMFLKIWNFVTSSHVDELYQSIDFISTVKACDQARKYKLMIGIIADTGMGKTTALRVYARQKNIFYISYDKTMNPTQFFSSLMKELSLTYTGTLNDMMNSITEEINSLESPMIIIDEAGKLTHAMILYLQVLRDKTMGSCSIVLAGMPYFRSNMQKYTAREKEGYAEFMRRINIWHSFEGLNLREIREICALHGVSGMEKKHQKVKYLKRFGDLMNEILLYKEINGIND